MYLNCVFQENLVKVQNKWRNENHTMKLKLSEFKIPEAHGRRIQQWYYITYNKRIMIYWTCYIHTVYLTDYFGYLIFFLLKIKYIIILLRKLFGFICFSSYYSREAMSQNNITFEKESVGVCFSGGKIFEVSRLLPGVRRY